MNQQLNIIVDGKRQLTAAGVMLSDITNGGKPCGGHGKCGKCKVVARGKLSDPGDAELKHLTAEELAMGVRLACQTYVLGDCEITTMSQCEKLQTVTYGAMPEFEIAPVFSKYGVAIDIGTTTLAARLYDNKGNMLAVASLANPQQKWGADVVSRIGAALGGRLRELSKAIRQALDSIISELSTRAVIDAGDMDGVVITGNTVMLSLLTEQSVEPFSHAPFAAERLFGEMLTGGDLELFNLMPDTPIYIPPCISAFIGADTTCAILATELCDNGTAMMADIGTNGEMALWHNGRLTVCSTAAGPAFEGVGITMGMVCADGAIDRVTVENGELKTHVIGDTAPVGLCGSGLADAVACLLDLKTIDESGYLEENAFIASPSVYITPKDIRMLQLAKSAICAGLLTLICEAELAVSDISGFYIAGGFGSYLCKESAIRIRLLPKALADVSTTVGNAALSGAVMLLLNAEARTAVQDIVHDINVLDLSVNSVFSQLFMMNMSFGEEE